jgi:myo-inositol 2-dehydrogenase / D-chiro-inositol 1-dehydrogenase
VVANIATFHKMITTDDVANLTVPPAVQSNLITIMGRTAAYEHRLVTWDEIVNCTTRLDPKLSALKA